MTNTKKRGRKTVPHRTSWGQTIDGLYRCPDGRWRIVATGQKFTEPDERIAVARFRQWQRANAGENVRVAVPVTDLPNRAAVHAAMDEGASLVGFLTDRPDELRLDVPETVLWPWLRHQLLHRPDYIAEHVGIPQLARLSELPLPRASVKLQTLIADYEQHAKGNSDTKRRVRRAWDDFTTATGATTLRDCSQEKFLAYNDASRQRYPDDTYRADVFARIKRVIKFGLKRGHDAGEIRAALDRAAVMYSDKGDPDYKPTPIARADFHRLLDHADDIDAAALLCSLNFCMYVSEVVSIDWDEMDLDAATFLSTRGKTSIIRAASLWPRTTEALKKLPRTDGPVFRSERGCRFHPNSLRKRFAALRTEAKVPDAVEHNHVRDGAYTACCKKDVGFHLAMILAGHKTAAESTAYIARVPEMVKPATDAIHLHYFGTLP